MGILAGARILIRYENSNGVWDFQHLIGFPRIVPKSHWGSGETIQVYSAQFYMTELSRFSDHRHLWIPICVGIIEIQWWGTWTWAGITEKVKVQTKVMSTKRPLKTASMTVCRETLLRGNLTIEKY